jgi:carboxypeptidase Q
MLKSKILSAAAMSALLLPTFGFAQATAPVRTDDAAVAKIKDEGMNRSQAMATMRYLTDNIGARLTNSPAQRRANQWTKEQLEKWGLKNAAVDPWGEFGRGWELKKFSAAVIAPEYMTIRAYPKAWSPSTNGVITGDVVYVDAATEADLEKYKGKLKGAIVLTQNERKVEPGFKPTARRHEEKGLTEMENAKLAPPATPQQQQQPNAEQAAAFRLQTRKNQFYYEEGAAMLVDTGFGTDSGTIRVMGASLPPAPANAPPPSAPSNMRVYSKGAPAPIPQIVMEVEQYNRLLRLLKQNTPIKMQVELAAQFYENDLQGYNTIAEIPGTDLKDEVVMIGAHLDSWHGAGGATDNGAGVTVVMEAMRILQASGLKPRRTIRVGLWTGEEQGLLGARGYVAKNFASIGDGSDNAAFGAMSGGRAQINRKPAHEKFAAYYNLDNGTGQIRGIYAQGNEAARQIFKNWLAPFKEWEATTTTISHTGGTDHLAFDAVGLPGFQFIQDPIEYTTRTWHTTQDVVDRILEEDLKRSAVIMATFAYNSAMTDEKLPRKEARPSVASLFRPLSYIDEIEEIAFRHSNLDFSICGHPVEAEEIPHGFPGVFALNDYSSHHNHDHAE